MSIANPVPRLPRRRLAPAVHVVRQAAGPADAVIVRELDDAAFPPSSADQQRADPGELEDGVAVGDVHLLERDGEVVAYLHLDRQVPGRIYVAGLAVRPDLQGGGLGALIMDHFIGSLEPERSTTAVVTVTSARNHFMLSLLLARGFAGRWLLRDFFGPGRHRFGCQVRTTSAPPAGPLHRAPADRLEEVYRLMEERQHVIRSLVQSDAGPQFLLSPAEPGEFLDCLPPG